MSFEILKKDPKSSARLGRIKTPHGEIHTPAFMPIGTKGAVKTLSGDEVKSLGAEVILANTYHLWIGVSPSQPPPYSKGEAAEGDSIIKKAGGLHKFMNWSGPIMTDSGGYQLFSLGEKIAKSKNQISNVKVTEDGVRFQDELSGLEHFLTPEKSVEIQNNLGSDIQVVLDEFTGEINNYEKVKATVERTTRWATRARVAKLSTSDVDSLQYAVVQGGMFEDLRKQSAMELAKLDFEGYCIGGVAVGGESSSEQYRAVEMSVPYLPEDKPRHLLGVGTPEQIIESVKRGIDTFDCVIPTREARHGKVYLAINSKSEARNPKQYLNYKYETIDISKAIFKEDFTSLDPECDCEACVKYSKAYLHHLFKSGEILALRLLTMHNVRFYMKLMENIRRDILNS